jgi:trehalose/maltose hydrolase-like predicted phosphorylase
MAERTTRPWELAYSDYDADEQPLREALCALGNGWIVTRGAFEEEAAGGPHYPGTYLAGGYNRLESEVSGRMLENEDLVNWPNWLPLTFRAAGGDWFSLDTVELLDFEVCLDVRRGVLERRLLFRDRAEREFSLTCRRIVHMAQPNLAAIVWSLTARDWSGEIEIRSGLDGTVRNGNVARYQKLETQHLEGVETGSEGQDTIYLTARTSQSRISTTLALRCQSGARRMKTAAASRSGCSSGAARGRRCASRKWWPSTHRVTGPSASRAWRRARRPAVPARSPNCWRRTNGSGGNCGASRTSNCVAAMSRRS